MNTILDYLTIDILTMYENNIKLHYVEYLERYVNVVWKKKFLIEKIRKLNTTKKEKDRRVSSLCNQLRKIHNFWINCFGEIMTMNCVCAGRTGRRFSGRTSSYSRSERNHLVEVSHHLG